MLIISMQWIVPTCLVFALRQQLDQVKLSQAGDFLMENSDVNPQAPLSTHNPFSSPFHHKAWVYSVLALSIVFLVLITVIRLI